MSEQVKTAPGQSEIPVVIICQYALRRDSTARSETARDQGFHQTHASGRTVRLTVSYSRSVIDARIDDIMWPSQVRAELQAHGRFDGRALSEAARTAVEEPLQEIHETVRNVLGLIKYHLRHFELHEGGYAITAERWGTGPADLKDVPRESSISVDSLSRSPLDEKARGAVQAALEAGHLPLVAMRHLHRAKLESQAHHKWIDATIAAELAVKEVLSRARPDLEPILLEVPSPPLSKLYGSLLKTYLGEESPYRKHLVKGQEVRNQLVHRPGALRIDHQEAIDYVANVERAIFHLLAMLYPQDALIRSSKSFVVQDK